MKNASKKRWIKALVGKLLDTNNKPYQQASGLLCSPTGDMCCLGVLYDIEFDGDWERARSTVTNRDCYKIDGETGTLNRNFRREMGITLPDEKTLIQFNDSGRTFKFIANWIKENL